MFRAGLYARVSTNDQQTIPLQIRALREYAVRRGWTIALQVKEVGSGASQRQLREKLLDAARRREIDVVWLLSFDPVPAAHGLALPASPHGARGCRHVRVIQGQARPGLLLGDFLRSLASSR